MAPDSTSRWKVVRMIGLLVLVAGMAAVVVGISMGGENRTLMTVGGVTAFVGLGLAKLARIGSSSP